MLYPREWRHWNSLWLRLLQGLLDLQVPLGMLQIIWVKYPWQWGSLELLRVSYDMCLISLSHLCLFLWSYIFALSKVLPKACRFIIAMSNLCIFLLVSLFHSYLLRKEIERCIRRRKMRSNEHHKNKKLRSTRIASWNSCYNSCFQLYNGKWNNKFIVWLSKKMPKHIRKKGPGCRS